MKVKQVWVLCILFIHMIAISQVGKAKKTDLLTGKKDEFRSSLGPLVGGRLNFQTRKVEKATDLTCFSDSVFDYSRNCANQWYLAGKIFYSRNGNYKTTAELHQIQTGTVWTNSFQLLYLYDNSGNLLSTLVQKWKNGVWVDSTSRNTAYANSRPITDVFQTWVNANWNNQYRYVNVFDPNGNEVSALLQNWINGSWVNARVINYTFDGSYNQTSQLVQDWNGSNWVNAENYTFTYDTNNRKTSQMFQFWNGTSWQNLDLFSYTWNSNNNLTTQLYMIWNGTSWAFDRLNILSYVASNNTNNLEQYLVNGIWKNQFQWTYTYDSNGNELSSTYQTRDSSGSAWSIRQKNKFTYCDNNCRESSLYMKVDSAGLLQKIDSNTTFCNALATGLKSWRLRDDHILLYPNPTSDKLSLTVPDMGKAIDIRVINALGNLVKQVKSETPQTVIDLEGLCNGVYFVTVTCDGISNTKKMVISK